MTYESKCISAASASFIEKIWKSWYPLHTARIRAYTWGRLKTLFTESISCFPLKNSKISIILEKRRSPIYPMYPLICTKRERIYIAQNIANVSIAYTIGSGKTGTWYGTGVWGCKYIISIPNIVSLPYTCPPNRAQTYHKTKTNKNARTLPSIYLLSELLSSLQSIPSTSRKPNIAQNSEKLYSFMIKNSNGFFMNFISFHFPIT